MKRITIIFSLMALLMLSVIPSQSFSCCHRIVIDYPLTSQCDCDIINYNCGGVYEHTYIYSCYGSCTVGTCMKVDVTDGGIATQWDCVGSCEEGIENCSRINGSTIHGLVPVCDCNST